MEDEMKDRMVRFQAKESSFLILHAIPGHFATSHSHVNYYVDVTSVRSLLSDAEEAAKILAYKFSHLKTIDTIVCMDGTDVIGGFLAKEFKNSKVTTTNRHNTIYVVSPEVKSDNHLILRDNTREMVDHKHCILLMATTTTGLTISRSMRALRYYGAIMEGVGAVFSTVPNVDEINVQSVYSNEDVTGYQAYPTEECPFCKKGIPLDAVVNGFGYSKL